MQLTRRKLITLAGLTGVAQAGQLNAVLKRRHGGEPGPGKPPAAAAPQRHKTLESPEELWSDLLEGNRRFVAGQPHPRALVRARKELVEGQHPKVIVLGCADSRVCPELLFDKNLGELFVVRTAGNVADPVALGSLEYAVEHLHARLMVVLGHESCGAVAAAVSGEKMPSPGLEAVVGRINPAIDRVRSLASGDELARLAVTMNVHQSAADLLRNSAILSREVGAGELAVIKAMYRLSTGAVVRL